MLNDISISTSSVRQINKYLYKNPPKPIDVSMVSIPLPEPAVEREQDQVDISHEGILLQVAEESYSQETETYYTSDLTLYSDYQLSQMLSKGTITSRAYYDELDRRK
mgnify:CR=1 FL=1